MLTPDDVFLEPGRKSVYEQLPQGRLAQLEERLVYTQ